MLSTRFLVVAFTCSLALLAVAPNAAATNDPVQVNSCINGGSTITVFGEDVVQCFDPTNPPHPKNLITCLILAQPPTACL